MNVVIIGSGYVGLVTGCCLAEAGNRVICIDHDMEKIAALQAGRLPFHEPELEELLKLQLRVRRLSFESDIAAAAQEADLIFLAVGTPSKTDGNANLDNLMRCVSELADTAFDDCIIVVKSTVPVGTGDRIEALLNAKRASAPRRPRVQVAANPEFLSEGRAVQDFRHPDRIVIGANDEHAASVLTDLYAAFDDNKKRLLCMDRRSAEFAKYACNAMLAARISMINELSGLAEGLGADIDAVCRVLKTDSRIGGTYLHPGVGYGGSCLPKDLHALIRSAQEIGEPAPILRSVQQVNQRQRQRLLEALQAHFNGRLDGRRIAVWGLSFKPGTDDVRAAPSLALIRDVLAGGASVCAYDPVAMDSARAALADAAVEFGASALDACRNADALVLMTEWDEFSAPDFDAVAARMRGVMVFDARRVYDTAELHEHGLQHYALGGWTSRPVAGRPERFADASRPQVRPTLRMAGGKLHS